MKTALGFLAAVLFAVVGSWQPAHAQPVPSGPYQSSCTEARMVGQSLIAFCKKSDGTSQTAVLADSNRCTTGITNDNGNLTCQETPAVGSSTPPAPQPQAHPTPSTNMGGYRSQSGGTQPPYPPAPGQAATPSGQPKGY